MQRNLAPRFYKNMAGMLFSRRFKSDVEEPGKKNESSTADSELLKHERLIQAEDSISAQDVLHAVKERDFAKVQLQATKLVQESWNDKYNVSVACIILLVTLWYWIAWTRRSIRRKCAAIEASVQKDTQTTVELVRSLTTKWERDLRKTNDKMEDIIDKNSDLTETIDHMTTALRSCISRPLPTLINNLANGSESNSNDM